MQDDEQTPMRDRIDHLRCELASAEQAEADDMRQTHYSTDELLPQLVEAVNDLRAEISGTFQGLGEAHRSVADAHSAALIAAIHTHTQMTREAIGQLRLTVERTVNALAATTRDAVNPVTLSTEQAAKQIAAAVRTASDELNRAIRDAATEAR